MKQKQYCNKFNKDFKNGPYQKKSLKRTNKNTDMSIKRCMRIHCDVEKGPGLKEWNHIEIILASLTWDDFKNTLTRAHKEH